MFGVSLAPQPPQSAPRSPTGAGRYMLYELKFSLGAGDRQIIRSVLAALGLAIRGEGQFLFATGPKLDAMTQGGDAHAFGARIVARLCELRIHDPTLVIDIALDSVIQHGAGSLYGTISTTTRLTGVLATGQVGTITASVSNESAEAKAAREAEERRLEYERRERLAIAHVVAPVQSPDAAMVEQLMQMDLSPTTIYNIIEVIEEEGSIPVRDLATEKQWKRCKRSMCHFEAVGYGARHVATTEEPPPNPMRLREAREFISSVALTWLEKKAGLRA